MSSAVAASTGWPVTRAPCIATCRLIAIAALDEFLRLSRMTTRVAVGATFCSISTSLPLRSVLRIDRESRVDPLLQQSLGLERFLNLGPRGNAIQICFQIRPFGKIHIDARGPAQYRE